MVDDEPLALKLDQRAQSVLGFFARGIAAIWSADIRAVSTRSRVQTLTVPVESVYRVDPTCALVCVFRGDAIALVFTLANHQSPDEFGILSLILEARFVSVGIAYQLGCVLEFGRNLDITRRHVPTEAVLTLATPDSFARYFYFIDGRKQLPLYRIGDSLGSAVKQMIRGAMTGSESNVYADGSDSVEPAAVARIDQNVSGHLGGGKSGVVKFALEPGARKWFVVDRCHRYPLFVLAVDLLSLNQEGVYSCR